MRKGSGGDSHQHAGKWVRPVKPGGPIYVACTPEKNARLCFPQNINVQLFPPVSSGYRAAKKDEISGVHWTPSTQERRIPGVHWTPGSTAEEYIRFAISASESVLP